MAFTTLQQKILDNESLVGYTTLEVLEAFKGLLVKYEVDIRVESGNIEWRFHPDGEYNTLISIDDLTGRNIEYEWQGTELCIREEGGTYECVDLQGEVSQADFDAHVNKDVEDDGGVHGLEVEKGSFAPTLLPDDGMVYRSQRGEYYLMGDMVFITLEITLDDKGTGTGDVIIESLPFTSDHTVFPPIRIYNVDSSLDDANFTASLYGTQIDIYKNNKNQRLQMNEIASLRVKLTATYRRDE